MSTRIYENAAKKITFSIHIFNFWKVVHGDVFGVLIEKTSQLKSAW